MRARHLIRTVVAAGMMLPGAGVAFSPGASALPLVKDAAALEPSAASEPSAAAGSLAASADFSARLAQAGLDNTIKLTSCSASLVRFPSSKGSDRAMMLTNGHCAENGGVDPGKVIVGRQSGMTGTLLGANGETKGTVQADFLLYGTTTDNDVALYQLTSTFDALAKSSKAKAFTIAARRAKNGEKMTIPAGFWKKVWHCSITGFVYTLHEGNWKWHDSIRYDAPPACSPGHGTSGSPIVSDTSMEIIGINNTGNDNGQKCTENNPCEEDKNGKVISYKKGQGYGQQTYWFTTCLNEKNAIDLKKKGCKLHGGDAGPFPKQLAADSPES